MLEVEGKYKNEVNIIDFSGMEPVKVCQKVVEHSSLIFSMISNGEDIFIVVFEVCGLWIFEYSIDYVEVGSSGIRVIVDQL